MLALTLETGSWIEINGPCKIRLNQPRRARIAVEAPTTTRVVRGNAKKQAAPLRSVAS